MDSYCLDTPLGELRFDYAQGVLRRLVVGGVEVLRGLSAPIRDTSWGTLTGQPIDSTAHGTGSTFASRLEESLFEGGAQSVLDIEIKPTERGTRLAAHFLFVAEQDVTVNRAGICLLHPLRGVRDTPFTVVRPDGSVETSRFPALISPGQVASSIAGLRHMVGGVAVDIRFDGEIFEMEDQRNWSDASFKTYCRPLSLPLPIRLAAGDRIEQSVFIEFGAAAQQVVSPASAEAQQVRLPEIWLAAEPDWLEASVPPCFDGMLARLSRAKPWTPSALGRLGQLLSDNAARLAVELVIAEDENPAQAITVYAQELNTAGMHPDYVTVLAEPYLKSFQPEGPWPDAVDQEQLSALAAKAFPKARIGRGVLTFFPEFNRKRPEAGAGDFITYGTAAIVHAADTFSVMETQEALPDIFQSARAIGGKRPQRLGLTTIGMRSNPYGVSLAPAAETPRTMVDHDARHFGPIGAAFGTALVLTAAETGIAALCPAAPGGPFGLVGSAGKPTPLAEALLTLRKFANAPCQLARDPNGKLLLTGPAGQLMVRPDPISPEVIFHAR